MSARPILLAPVPENLNNLPEVESSIKLYSISKACVFNTFNYIKCSEKLLNSI